MAVYLQFLSKWGLFIEGNEIVTNLSDSFKQNTFVFSFQDFENTKPILLECLKALKSYSNNKVSIYKYLSYSFIIIGNIWYNQIGLTDVLNNDDAINLICRAVDPHDANCMLEAVRLISVFCIVPPSG